MPTTRHDLPIAALLPRIAASLAAHPRLVLEAPPGAGKTTQVPLALLDAPWLAGRRILMLEPRRVAARAAAGFMAQQLGEAVGDTVGYRIRFEHKVSARTRIEVVTEGILTRMLQDDPTLGEHRSDGIGALLFDEFHERHLTGDLGLALALDVQAGLREDLRIVLMSATLDGERLAQWLDAPRLSSAGRSFPVEVAHFPTRRDEALEHQVRRAIEHASVTHPGDILVFLPGQREIARTQALLRRQAGGAGAGVLRQAGHGWPAPESGQDVPIEGRAIPPLPHRPPADSEILALHGDLPIDQQSRVLQPAPDGTRRIILATNVAESSVTLPGVRVVIDAGLAREPRFDPNSGFSRLDVIAISQASADQRAGRAGRVAAGWAYRLWPPSQRLEPQRRPEILQVELAGLALELAAWGSDALRFVDPPPAGAMAAARDLLQRLGALDAAHAITAAGRRMLALGTHPRLAAMLLAPAIDSERALACDLAALLEARDPVRGSPGQSPSDALAERWQALSGMRSGRSPTGANRGALAAIDAVAIQWRRRLRLDARAPADAPAHLLGDRLLHAYPDRIARQHPSDPRRYQLANGRMARLQEHSALYGEPWIVASELRGVRQARGDRSDVLVLRGAPLDPARLQRDFAERFVEQDTVRWDPARRALVAQRERRFDAIVLDARASGQVDPSLAARALTDAVRELGLAVLPWSDGLSQWRARVRSLRAWMPADRWPDLSDSALLATLDAWLAPALAGKTRLDALTSAELADALQSLLAWPLRQRLDQLAPTRILVPSGQERRIVYAADDDAHADPAIDADMASQGGIQEGSDHVAAPVLAVKLQELFGLADTPRIAEGRIPLTLHLLSPAGRPLQVTRDLRGFWERTYPEVKKEMKGRYPRHPWPEDPWSATATHRAKRKGT